MRIFHIHSHGVHESDSLPALEARGLPAQGFVWIACNAAEFESALLPLQNLLHMHGGSTLLDLHVSDLLNTQLPSRYDYTSLYDLLVFRRLGTDDAQARHANTASRRGGPPILRRIDTSPIGFAVFDRIVMTVHPDPCTVLQTYAHKLLQSASPESRTAGARLPSSPADLMLRVIHLMVDGYLSLRRELSQQLDHWQSELLQPKSRFNNWPALLDARQALHQLDEICEDQRTCIQDWIEALKTWPDPATPAQAREYELLQVRSRDVLEHIERVVHHVRRLELSVESAVQIHFNAQSHRTNEIMRTLTVLTAIFLPLNLIAGIFGMNFDTTPLLHAHRGFWWAMAGMGLIATALALFFWRKRYLSSYGR